MKYLYRVKPEEPDVEVESKIFGLNEEPEGWYDNPIKAAEAIQKPTPKKKVTPSGNSKRPSQSRRKNV